MSDLSDLFESLATAAFRRDGADLFTALTTIPEWLSPLLAPGEAAGSWRLGERSFFLEHFLIEAEEFWAKNSPEKGAFPSAVWSEPALDAGRLDLRVTALSRGGKHFLVIAPAGHAYEEQWSILQHARQGQLEQEALAREIEKKEVLVHCIVHDLANPLTAIMGSLGLVERTPLTESARSMVKNALTAADRQHALIREILDVFSAEATALEPLNFDPRQAPDLIRTAHESIEHMAVAYQRRNVMTRLIAAPASLGILPVMAEQTRLERIFANLLENALRYSPRDSEVVVSMGVRDGWVDVRIEDAGSGVPTSAISNLFQKLAPGSSGKRGKAGLGLYFCRITVERWGGNVGYEALPTGGACFWFRLRTV